LPNAKGPASGNTAVYRAVTQNHISCTRLLIENNALIDTKNKKNESSRDFINNSNDTELKQLISN